MNPLISIRLNEAIIYRENKQYDLAGNILWELHEAHPDNPNINYQLAWWHDVQSKERDAIPFYETAIANGLQGDELRGALLGLGSTYRCLGRYDDAVATFQKGITLFPDAHEFPVFLAMAHYNLGQHAEAMRLLLHTLAETSQHDDILRYQKAIRFYHDNLDQVWE